MSIRYTLDRAADGTYSYIDIFTGWVAVFAGRELSRIPADMAEAGLHILNALDATERSVGTTRPVGPASALKLLDR